MGLIREIRDYRNFFSDERVAKRVLVFYSFNRFYYQHVEQIINHILEKTDIHVDYITSDPGDPVFKKESNRFTIYLCKNLLASLIAKIKTKALVMTMTDLGTFHIKKASPLTVIP